MTVTYTLHNGHVWQFANVPTAVFAAVAAGLDGPGWVDVTSHGDCLRSPNDSDVFRVADIAAIRIDDL